MKSSYSNLKIITLLTWFTIALLRHLSFADSTMSTTDAIARFQSLSPSEAYASKDFDQLTQKIFISDFEASIAPRRLCVYDRFIFGTEMRDHCSQWSITDEGGVEQQTCVERKYDFPVTLIGDLSPYFEVTFVENNIELGRHLYPLQNCNDVVSSKRASGSTRDASILVESSGEYSGGSIIKKKKRD